MIYTWANPAPGRIPPGRSTYLQEYAVYECHACLEHWSTTTLIHKAPSFLTCSTCHGWMFRKPAPPKPQHRIGEW